MTGPSAFRGSNSSGWAPINPKIKTLNLRTMRERSAKAGLNPWRFRRVMLATFSLFENASKIAIFRLKIFGCIKTFLDSLFKYYLDADRISTLPLKTFEKMCKLPNIFNLQNQQNSFFNNFLNLEKCNKSHKKKIYNSPKPPAPGCFLWGQFLTCPIWNQRNMSFFAKINHICEKYMKFNVSNRFKLM